MNMNTIEVKPSKFGKGVFALQDFKRNEKIGKVKGRVYDFPKAPECAWDYLIDLHKDNKVVNPCTPFRYLNHCCSPNCRLSSDGEKVTVIATKAIKRGEELTIDYSWDASAAVPCGCGSKKCRGYIVNPSELHLVKAGV